MSRSLFGVRVSLLLATVDGSTGAAAQSAVVHSLSHLVSHAVHEPLAAALAPPPPPPTFDALTVYHWPLTENLRDAVADKLATYSLAAVRPVDDSTTASQASPPPGCTRNKKGPDIF